MTQKNIKTENSGQPMAKYDDIISTVFVQNFKKEIACNFLYQG